MERIDEKIEKILDELWKSYRSYRSLMDNEFYGFKRSLMDENYERIEIIEQHKNEFKENSIILKNLVLVFLESNNLYNYLKLYSDIFESFYADDKKLISGYSDDELGFTQSYLLSEYYKFLTPFDFFNNDEYFIRKSGLKYLENILRNTGVILKQKNIKPTTEPMVYREVKLICEVTFPDIIFPQTPFIKKVKQYKPDILIPSLNCAIEYKYADKENKLVKIMDQIFEDVHGYSNHSIYRLFYAVFYVTPGIWSDDRFNHVWKEKKFPNNWKPFYIVGQ
jgi:hypothetical protein